MHTFRFSPIWLPCRCIFVAVLCGCFATTCALAQDTPPRKRTIERAKRPTFTPRDWDGIYFEDLFSEGLVGERPSQLGRKPPMAAVNPATDPAAAPTESVAGWAGLISSSALEDEIKNAQLQLEGEVTTLQNFKSDTAKVRESLARLAMWFAIVAEFEDSVRWKSDASVVRDAMAQASANARTSSDDAFASVKTQKEQLAELIRGGKFSTTGAKSVEMNWSHWVDRVAVMTRLELALTERIKPWTSSESEFAAHAEEILHEAHIVAAIGQAMVQPEVIDADDDEYAGLAQKMTQAARELQQALQANQFEAASSAANRISNECANCHEAYR